MTDLAEPRDVSERNRRIRVRDNERLAALGGIMEVREGRCWLHDLLLRCHMFESSFSNNPHVTSFREGERNVGLQVMADLMRVAPNEYVTMMREANERDSSSAAAG